MLKKLPILFVSLIADMVMTSGSVAGQVPEAAPSTPEGHVSTSFQFYPEDKGFGEYFDPVIEPGSSAQLAALLVNTGEVEQELTTYAVNASTAPGGGFQAADYGDETPNEVTSWLDYSEETFTLSPEEGVERTFTIEVPAETQPGQYLTAIAAEHGEASQVEGTDVFTQKLRYVIPVFITVPGETTAGFDIGEVGLESLADTMVVRVQLINTGDVRVRPEGELEILDTEGNLLVSIPVRMESIYAHDETLLTLGVPGSVGGGAFQVNVDLQDPETGEVARTQSGNLDVQAAATPAAPAPITIASASVEPGPSADNVQFAVVDATISNTGEPVTNAQLSLLVFRDGEEVERFPISQSLSLPQGDTEVNTRYIPLDGWSSGEWIFELLLETVEPSGAAVVVASQPIEGSITIP